MGKALSDVYRLEREVRQGGLSSPRLLNLYMGELIARLSSTGIGYSIGGTTVNKISYADNMAAAPVDQRARPHKVIIMVEVLV